MQLPTPTNETARFFNETLVTDTRSYEVVGRTAKTIRVRACRETDIVLQRGSGPYPVVVTMQRPDPRATVQTLRLRKDGTYRFAQGRTLLPVAIPTRRVDWSF